MHKLWLPLSVIGFGESTWSYSPPLMIYNVAPRNSMDVFQMKGQLMDESGEELSKEHDQNKNRAVFQTEWTALNPESLAAAPCLLQQTLCEQPSGNEQQPQLARDVPYAQAILDAWKEEEAESPGVVWEAEWCNIQYSSVSEGYGNPPLYGHLIRRQPSSSNKYEIGVIFFHTGAGPHDLFLLYKAASLVNSFHDKKEDIIVFIVDLLADESGWAWNPDRSRYNRLRDSLLSTENNRALLRLRVQAAVDVLRQQYVLKPLRKAKSIAAFGWCFGGHAILELAKLQIECVGAMATFHGVFDGATAHGAIKATPNGEPRKTAEILICHGTDDPYSDDQSLENALSLLDDLGYHRTCLLQLNKAKHGFTNPGQASFDYDPIAARKAWKQTLSMLQRNLLA